MNFYSLQIEPSIFNTFDIQRFEPYTSLIETCDPFAYLWSLKACKVSGFISTHRIRLLNLWKRCNVICLKLKPRLTVIHSIVFAWNFKEINRTRIWTFRYHDCIDYQYFSEIPYYCNTLGIITFDSVVVFVSFLWFVYLYSSTRVVYLVHDD